jgi:hypothetical protein
VFARDASHHVVSGSKVFEFVCVVRQLHFRIHWDDRPLASVILGGGGKKLFVWKRVGIFFC